MHIAKNRGIRLTRGLKDDISGDEGASKEAEKERTSAASSANETRASLARLGSELGFDSAAHPSQLLVRLGVEKGFTRLKKGRKGTPTFTRKLIEAELLALLKSQSLFHKKLTDSVVQHLFEIVFREKIPAPPAIGECRYGIKGLDGQIERRLPRGTDLCIRKRIYEEVNNLRLISTHSASEKCLSTQQRDHIVALLLEGEEISATKLRSELRLGKSAGADKTSLDISQLGRGRKTAAKLVGHPVAAAMGKAGLLDEWEAFEQDKREIITQILRTEDDIEQLIVRLSEAGISSDAAMVFSECRLPAFYSAAGETATRKILEQLELDVISNHEAETRAGLEVLDPDPPQLDYLPYYGELFSGSCVGGTNNPKDEDETRFGRIPNPVVHVALNQIRKVANAYIDLYGKPQRVCIELARDMNKSTKAREDAETEAEKNRKTNENYIETLGLKNRKLSADQLLRIKLHRMQGGECLYTGQPISAGQLFDGSVEVDHILPRADTMDDGISNRALVLLEANQEKRKRTPYEAFSAGYNCQDYEHLLKRALKRGPGVYWRFRENSMERFTNEGHFQARFLNDTRYISKMAAKYLSSVSKHSQDVICLNGQITSKLRRSWGLATLIRDVMISDGRLDPDDIRRPETGETLESLQKRRALTKKIRWDHRHHLLDAIVSACTTRADVQRLQTLSGVGSESLSAKKFLEKLRQENENFKGKGICWDSDFRSKVEEFLTGDTRGNLTDEKPVTAVVTKADHDPIGQLHKGTNYSVICAVPNQNGQFVTKDHLQIEDLTAKQIENLQIPETAIAAIEDAHSTGLPFWWGEPDPVSSVRKNLSPDIDNLRTRLLQMMKETPSENLLKARTPDGKEKARAVWATKQFIEQTGRRRYTRLQVQSLRILKGPEKHGGKIKRAVPTRANDRLIYFRDAKGGRDLEVISTLDANRPAFIERWKSEGGRHLFTLRNNDLVEMLVDPENPGKGRGIFRLVSYSYTTGIDLDFLPVEEARTTKEVPKHVRTRISSVRSFEKYEPSMIICDQTGRIRWRSPRTN